MKKKIKIGIDLDGVIVGKPFFIPKKLIERLFQGNGKNKNQLHYRFPKSKLEQKIRILSHHWFFRPLMKKNWETIKKISHFKNTEIYIISSRYNFLKKRTKQWFKKNKIENHIKKVFLNLKNDQPHLFKEKLIKKLKLDYYLEDDQRIIKYLKEKFPSVKIIFVSSSKSLNLISPFKNKLER